MSVCRPHPYKMAHWAIFPDADTDTDDRNSLNAFFHFYPETDARKLITERWNSGMVIYQTYLIYNPAN